MSVRRNPDGIGWRSGDKRATVIPDGVCSVDAELGLWVFGFALGALGGVWRVGAEERRVGNEG